MGYETYYHLETKPDLSELPGVVEVLKDETQELFWALLSDGSARQEITWYEHEADMIDLSRQFLNVLFILSGEGEENGDAWRKYFQFGKLQATARAELVYPNVDTTSFKP